MAYKAGRREEIARLLGFDSYRKQLAFQRGSDANRQAVQRRREDLERQGLVGKGAARISHRNAAAVGNVESRRRVFVEPDGRFVRTNRDAELRAFFRIAARNDGTVTDATVTVNTTTRGKVDVELWSKGGMRAEYAHDAIEALRLAGVEKPALAFIVGQIMATGARSYLPADPTVGDIALVQMGAEW